MIGDKIRITRRVTNSHDCNQQFLEFAQPGEIGTILDYDPLHQYYLVSIDVRPKKQFYVIPGAQCEPMIDR